MQTVASRASRYEFPAFVLLAFAFSWTVWLADPGVGPASLRNLLGAFGPSLAGVAVVGATRGSTGLRRLLSGLARWRVGFRWYAVALGLPAAVSLVGTAAWVALGGPLPDFASPPVLELYPIPPSLAGVGPWPLLPLVFVQTLLVGSPMGEEIGWRGVALPRLQESYGAVAASLALGAIWGAWHLPLWLAPGPGGVSPGWAFAGILADAFLFTWLWNNTDRSLLLAVLFHAAIAVTGLFVAAPDAAFLGPAVTWLVVAGLLWTHDWETLTRRAETDGESGLAS